MKPSVPLLLVSLCFLLFTCSPPLSKKRLLVMGDSNGVREGWVYQLQNLRGGGPLVNTSISGNTIGFSYGGSDLRLNTLENLTNYLRKGYAEMGAIDEVLIALGTNDCKVEFAERHDQIASNLDTLLSRSNAFFTDRGQDLPRYVILSPPPLDDRQVVDNFRNATVCTQEITKAYRRIATERGLCFVDLQKKPGAAALSYSTDGIHFKPEGYRMIAEAVIKACY